MLPVSVRGSALPGHGASGSLPRPGLPWLGWEGTFSPRNSGTRPHPINQEPGTGLGRENAAGESRAPVPSHLPPSWLVCKRGSSDKALELDKSLWANL